MVYVVVKIAGFRVRPGFETQFDHSLTWSNDSLSQNYLKEIIHIKHFAQCFAYIDLSTVNWWEDQSDLVKNQSIFQSYKVTFLLILTILVQKLDSKSNVRNILFQPCSKAVTFSCL